MPDKTLEILTREIAAALALDASSLKASDRLVPDLGAESLDLVDLTFRIEKSFCISIPHGDLFESKTSQLQKLTIQDVAEYVLKLKASQPS